MNSLREGTNISKNFEHFPLKNPLDRWITWTTQATESWIQNLAILSFTFQTRRKSNKKISDLSDLPSRKLPTVEMDGQWLVELLPRGSPSWSTSISTSRWRIMLLWMVELGNAFVLWFKETFFLLSFSSVVFSTFLISRLCLTLQPFNRRRQAFS